MEQTGNTNEVLLSVQAGLSRATIGRILGEKSDPKQKSLAALAAALGVPEPRIEPSLVFDTSEAPRRDKSEIRRFLFGEAGPPSGRPTGPLAAIQEVRLQVLDELATMMETGRPLSYGWARDWLRNLVAAAAEDVGRLSTKQGRRHEKRSKRA